MEEDKVFLGKFDLHSVNENISRQVEENEKRIREHYQRLLTRQKEIESQEQKLHSFVCDWQ